MFAFALVDTEARRLYLARDAFGIKPLFYAQPRGSFVFASEIPALLEFSGVSRRANAARVVEFLNEAVGDYGGETFFADIRQVAPGHYLEISLDAPSEARVEQWWKPDLTRLADISFREAAERLREMFLKSVSLHLRSDVPLGIALSGGIDSSAVLGACRQLSWKDAELHSFSYIADDPAICEERWADEAGTAAGSVAHRIRIGQADIARDFERLVALQGEPIPAPVAYAQWRVFSECRSAGIKVLLEGQGSDELLAGYPEYTAPAIAAQWRRGRLGTGLGIARTSGRGSMPLMKAALRLLAGGRKSEVFRWIDAPRAAERGGFERGSPLRLALRDTLCRSKIPSFLRWADRSAMACSIENRVPFLTIELTEFLYGLPEEYLISGDGVTKAVFREAMRGLVPEAILRRRDKIGFTTPYRNWLRAMRPHCAELLAVAETIPVLRHDVVARECAPFLAGAEPSLPVVHHLWGVLFLAAWVRRFGVTF
jgi:asparagine synthase (glutamine-hydrolysing)